MNVATLLALLLAVGLITALCWRYAMSFANAVRRGEIEADDDVEVSGF